MNVEDRLKAAGWSEHGNDRAIRRHWTKDGVDWYTEAEALHEVMAAERDAAIARAEAAEALAASMLDVSPEDAHDVFVHGVELSAHYDDAEDMGALVRIRAALRAHAAKVSR